MFTNSTLFGIIFSLIKTAPKARGFEKKFQNLKEEGNNIKLKILED